MTANESDADLKKFESRLSSVQLAGIDEKILKIAAAAEDESLEPLTIVNAKNDPELDQVNLVAPRFLITVAGKTYLRVIVPQWPLETPDEEVVGSGVLFLTEASTNPEDVVFVYDVMEEKASYEIDIPIETIWKSNDPHGTFVLTYIVEGVTGNQQKSKAVVYTIDAINPFKNVVPAPLVLPADLPAGGVITGDYLNRNPSLKLTLPPYTENDYRKFDQFAIVVNDDRQTLAWIDLPQGTGFVYEVPSATVRSVLREGANTLQVIFRDYSWNISQPSAKVDVQFREAGVPTGLQKPRLSKVTNKFPDIVNLIDAKFGVDVRADYENARATDTIEVYFDDERVGEYTTPATAFKVTAAAFNKQEGFYTAVFKYRVRRDGLWSTFSPSTEIQVDLRIVEPKPDYPDYISEQLPLLSLQVPGSPLNTVEKSNPQAGVITVPLLPSAVAGTIINVHVRFLTQDIDELESGNQRTISQADINAGKIEIPVSWEMLQELLPSGKIGSFYRLRVPNGASYIESLHTTLFSNLTDVSLSQGQFEPRRVYVNRLGVRYINCETSQPWLGINFLITHLPGFKPTDVLRGFFSVTGSDPVDPSQTVTVDYVSEVRNPTGQSAQFNVPYNEFFSKVKQGTITAYWQLIGRLPGESGVTDQPPYTIRYDRQRPGGATCEGPLR